MSEPTGQKQSRIGKRPLVIPSGVQVSINGPTVSVKGPKGESRYTTRPEVKVSQEGDKVIVAPTPGSGREGTQYQGLTRAMLGNMVQGCHEGFKLSLDFRGVGYRAEVKGQNLNMVVGLSHHVNLDIPASVKMKVETIDEAGTKYPRLHLESHDKAMLGQTAARIRSMRPPEPYKGKGVRYTNERVQQKAGKAGKAAK